MTTHKIICSNSDNLSMIADKSIHLIVTSPPYPMISMWNEVFMKWSNDDKLFNRHSTEIFKIQHDCLNNVWQECDRVLIDGGFICINIGDATRTFNDNFQLFSNHSEIINWFTSHEYFNLPDIIWHKPTNSPNSFMGSGMYPAGAYVTYEHEYILIFRKGNNRIFTNEEQIRRKQSAYFWEERNEWFSDIWNIKGTNQIIKNLNSNRQRNASFPFEIPYRLINMYSIEGDTILDPFNGLGTTTLSAIASNRNSIGIDIDKSVCKIAKQNISISTIPLNSYVTSRLNKHKQFVADNNDKLDYFNNYHNLKVMTKQEQQIQIKKPIKIYKQDDCICCNYD